MAFDLADHVLQGFHFSQTGSVVTVVSPTGRVGSGASPEEAVLNIDAQIIPVSRGDYVGRLLIRTDGTEVQLDGAGVIAPEPVDPVADAAAIAPDVEASE